MEHRNVFSNGRTFSISPLPVYCTHILCRKLQELQRSDACNFHDISLPCNANCNDSHIPFYARTLTNNDSSKTNVLHLLSLLIYLRLQNASSVT
jgi:hypothetical protein